MTDRSVAILVATFKRMAAEGFSVTDRLSRVGIHAETLEMGRIPDARRQEYLGVITQETDRLTHLVNNILNFSRMEAGRKPYSSEPVQVPRRPKPVMTSSHTISTPCRSQISRTLVM